MRRKSKSLIIAANIAHNLIARWRLFRGNVESEIGSTHARLSTEQSVEYINRVFRNYLEYAGLTEQDLAGKKILELGPGDNLGVALRLYAAGAAHVTCLDKFRSQRDDAQQKKIYEALRATLPPAQQARYDAAISLTNGISIDDKCVRYVYGVAAEDCGGVLQKESFDLVISRAVIWEIYETQRALAALDSTLRRGGMMIHKIACIDWMFRQNGYHPLEFLTISEPVYRWLARDSGKSNRRTVGWYRNIFKNLGYDARFQVTQIVGRKGEEFAPGVLRLERGVHYTDEDLRRLQEIKPRLLPRFREQSDEDLLIEDMFVVAVKASAGTP